MKRLWLAVVGVGAVSVVGSALTAQNIRFGAGGGLLMPLSDYKTQDKAGWVGGVDATYWLTGRKIGLRVEGDYSQTSSQDSVAPAHKSKIFGGLGEVVYAFGVPSGQIRPYVLGGIGIFNFKADITGSPSASQSKVGFGAGAGVALKVGAGSARVFLEGRFTSVSTNTVKTTFIPIRAGLRFGGQ